MHKVWREAQQNTFLCVAAPGEWGSETSGWTDIGRQMHANLPCEHKKTYISTHMVLSALFLEAYIN